MTSYNCSELVQADNGYYMCKTWVEVPATQSNGVVSNLVITPVQSIGLATIVITIFFSAYGYKLLERSFLNKN